MTVSPLNRDFIAGFQRGSFESVRELYHLYYSSLTDFAGQLTQHTEQAHSIVLDAMVKLFVMRDRFNSMQDIKAFLYITVRNTCFAWLKSERQPAASGETAWYLTDEDNANRFNDETVRAAAIRDILNEVDQLPLPVGDVFKLIFCNRLLIPQVAEQLGIDQQTVVTHRMQAIQLLRETLFQKQLFSIPLFIYFLSIACQEAMGNGQ